MMIRCFCTGLRIREPESLERLLQLGDPITKETYASLLRACATRGNLAKGKRLHARMNERGESSDRYLGNLLVEMYGKCGAIEQARQTFHSLKRKNIFSWNIMLGAYAQNGHHKEALDLFRRMEEEEIEPSNVTFVSLLSACSDLGDLEQGKALHARISETEFESQTIVANALISMYGRCRGVTEARVVFDALPSKDIISWNSIISAYAQNGHCTLALAVYQLMDPLGVKPNRITFLNALDACSIQRALPQGKAIHSRIIESGLESDIPLSNSLVNMYAKCGRLEQARELFHRELPRNVVSWTAMITAYAQNGQGYQSLHLYKLMDLNGILPDEITFISVLDACASVKALSLGREVHQLAVLWGVDRHLVLATALVNMYGECGEVDQAREVFDGLTNPNVVSWNTMIGAYARNGYPLEALELFHRMGDEQPNQVTLANALEACATLSDLKQGRQLHARAEELGLHRDNVVGSALVDLYGRCGSVKEARLVFANMSLRDVVSWTCMISAYSTHGWGDEALELFSEMNVDGVFPNSVTFLCVLAACGHSGLLKTGRDHFLAMPMDFGIETGADQFDCLVDVFCRAGKLEAAEELIEGMPFQPGPVVWMSLLSASRLNGDYVRGEHAALQLLELDPGNPAVYLVISNIS